jgi:hypothetical protein
MRASGKAFLLTAAAAALLVTAPATAVTVGASSANFFNVVGGSSVVYRDQDGLTGNEILGFGDPVPSSTQQNVFTFVSGGAGDVTLDTQFTLGTFRFDNAPVYGEPLTTVDLSLSTIVDGFASPNFLFRLALDQTPNDNPCAYPSTVPCSDALSVSILAGSGTFTANGTEYTLFIDGFRNEAGTFSSLFIGDEDTATTASIVGRFAPAVAGAVPEPASWAMMVGGFGLLGAAMRRRPTPASAQR